MFSCTFGRFTNMVWIVWERLLQHPSNTLFSSDPAVRALGDHVSLCVTMSSKLWRRSGKRLCFAQHVSSITWSNPSCSESCCIFNSLTVELSSGLTCVQLLTSPVHLISRGVQVYIDAAVAWPIVVFQIDSGTVSAFDCEDLLFYLFGGLYI